MTEREALKIALQAFKTIDEAMPFPVAKLAQSAIKEALAQTEQEPVAWKTDDVELYVREDKFGFYNIPLYTSPPQRKPLTPQEINQIEARWDAFMHGSKIAFVVRETEAAHGIKGEA